MEPTRENVWIVPRVAVRERLDRFVATNAPHLSRSRIQSLIRAGHVRVNGEQARASDAVREGDAIALHEPTLEKLAIAPEKMPLEVLFEDEDLLVLNKAAGVVVHPGAGQTSGTLVNALLAHCTGLSGIGGVERPGIVHRLDKETSGCLVIAKNDAAHQKLSAQFASRDVEKTYLAIVAGVPRRKSGTIDAPIARHPVDRKRMSVAAATRGRTARTDYVVTREGPSASLLECKIHSGRTHQIRVHLQHIGHPVLGDRVYAGKRAGHFPRQMLHAWKLGFAHPKTGTHLMFEAPPPEDFATALQELFDV